MSLAPTPIQGHIKTNKSHGPTIRVFVMLETIILPLADEYAIISIDCIISEVT